MWTTVVLLGCPLGDVKLGEDAEQNASDDGDDSSAGDPTATGATPAGGLGSPCDHGYAPGTVPEAHLVTTPAPSCAGDICLYAESDMAPSEPCASDEECNQAGPTLDRFRCDLPTNTCELSEAYFLERSMCSNYCESDMDCVADGATNCELGFKCVVMSSIGDSCCRPMCACIESIEDSIVYDLTMACEDGTAQGCCDQSPGQGLCPD